MNKLKDGEYYVIYSRWLAAELRDAGFSIEKVKANPNKPEFDCYLFKDSYEFQKAITKITHKKRD